MVDSVSKEVPNDLDGLIMGEENVDEEEGNEK